MLQIRADMTDPPFPPLFRSCRNLFLRRLEMSPLPSHKLPEFFASRPCSVIASTLSKIQEDYLVVTLGVIFTMPLDHLFHQAVPATNWSTNSNI